MIFHVTIACHQVRNVILGEFREDNVKRLLQKVRQHIETAAVRHSHANLFNPGVRAFLQNYVKDHHQRFRPLERETLLSDVMRM